MKSMPRSGCLLVVVLGLACGGCASPPGHPPRNLDELQRQQKLNPQDFTPRTIALYNVGRVLSAALPDRERVASLRVVEELDLPSSEACPALAQVLVDPSAPGEVRQAVLAFLAERRYPGLSDHVAAMLPEAKDAAARTAMLEWLEEHPAPGVLADVVKLWAAEARTDEADEARYRRIVEKISGRAWDQALAEALNTEDFFARGSALEVLARRLPEPLLRAKVGALTARTDAVRAMQTFRELFDYLPKTRRELVATVVAEAKGRRALVMAADLANRWRGRSGYRFNIRDLHLLTGLSGDSMKNTRMSRAQLSLEISRALFSRRVNPAPSRRGKVRLRRGRLVDFDAQVQSLSTADLWRLLLLNEMFSRPSVREAFRISGLRDRADTQTQWGGLVFYGHGLASAKLYPPEAKRGDDQYDPGKQMLWDSLDAVCFFIGHFSKPADDPASVGPTSRELDLAKAHNVCGAVVTGLPDGGLNVAYLNPDGVVVDLGDFPPVR